MSARKKKSSYFVWSFFIAVLFVHFWIVQLKFLSLGEAFDGEPITNFDYGVHYYDVLKGVESLNEDLSFVAYDDAFMAGYQKGFVDDLSSKLWIVFAWIFQGIGMMSAFKLFVWLALLLMPLLFFAALRIVGFNLAEATLGMIAAVVYQNTFKMGNFLWVGMITFPLAIYLSFLGLAFLKRYFNEARLGWLIAFSGVAVFAFYAHILAAILLGIPALILYAVYYKDLNKKQHDHFWWTPFVVLGLSLPWVIPLFEGLNLRDFSEVTRFFQTPDFAISIREIFAFSLPENFHSVNIRAFLLVLGLLSLIFLWKKNRRASIFIGSTWILFMLITYSGFDFLREIQPYRFLVVGDLWMITAILFLLKELKLKDAICYITAFLMFFIAAYVDGLRMERILSNDLPDGHKELVEYLNEQDVDGRILYEVEHSADAVFLHLKTGLNMIGGPYRYFPTKHNELNFTEEKLFGVPLDALSIEEFEEGLENYDIQYAICHSEKACSVLDDLGKKFFLRKEIGQYTLWR